MSTTQRARLIDATERTCVGRSRDGAQYTGRFGDDWNIGTVPNGGYSLGTLVHCAKDFVDGLVAGDNGNDAASTSRHAAMPDFSLLHAGAAYLVAATSTKDWHVDVTLLKKGRSYINLDCVLKQASRKKGSTDLIVCQRTNLIFANFAATHIEGPGTSIFSVPLDSPFAFKSPIQSPPIPRSECSPWFPTSPWPRQGTDMAATNKEREKSGRLFWAGYIYMPEQDDELVKTPSDVARYNHTIICMLCDMAGMTKYMLPPTDKRGETRKFWFPTLFLGIEVKRALPTDFAITRATATACTVEVRPGQWTYDLEIWSHPDDAARLKLPSGMASTRLAISRQVASMVSFSVNQGFVQNKEGSKDGRSKL